MSKKHNITIDPEFRDMIPPLSQEEQAGLEDSVRKGGAGPYDPLSVWLQDNGTMVLVDGHHRYDICERWGLPFEIRKLRFRNRLAAQAWILCHQINRRNLSPAMRVQLALHLEDILAKGAEERRKSGKKSDDDDAPNQRKTASKVAETAGVSRDTVNKVKFVEKHGDDETKAKMSSGEMTVNAAHKATKRRNTEKQKAEAERTRDAAPGRNTEKQKKKKGTQPETPLDPHGKPLTTGHLVNVFGDLTLSIEHCKGHVRAIKTVTRHLFEHGFDQMLPGGAKQQFDRDLRNVWDALNHLVPYTVCPECEGHDDKCATCRGQGWINEPMFKNLPKGEKR